MWLVHTALGQCQGLLERAIVLEDKELGLPADKENTEYLSQRKVVKERLGHLLQSTKSLLVDGVGTATVVTGQERSEVGSFVGGSYIGCCLRSLVLGRTGYKLLR